MRVNVLLLFCVFQIHLSTVRNGLSADQFQISNW